MNNVTGKIKIVKIPAGEAPEWVRKACVGRVFPCSSIIGFPDNGEPEKGVLTGKVIKYDGKNRYSISVSQKYFIRILNRFNQKAAKWWKLNGFPKPAPDDYFSFGEHEVEIISGVKRQVLQQYLGVLEVGC